MLQRGVRRNAVVTGIDCGGKNVWIRAEDESGDVPRVVFGHEFTTLGFQPPGVGAELVVKRRHDSDSVDLVEVVTDPIERDAIIVSYRADLFSAVGGIYLIRVFGRTNKNRPDELWSLTGFDFTRLGLDKPVLSGIQRPIKVRWVAGCYEPAPPKKDQPAESKSTFAPVRPSVSNDALAKLTAATLAKRTETLEAFIAWQVTAGVDPRDCQLVEETKGSKTTWRLEKK